MLESLSSEELLFIKAIEKYKQEHGRLFLSWTEVLKIIKKLGYRKSARPVEEEDATEKRTEPEEQPAS